MQQIYLLKNWKQKAYRVLMLVLALIPGTALSETWDRNLDLTIPSLETPSTWQLDSKAKQEIMMGYECCYHSSLRESVRNEALLKSITSKSKVKLNELQFSPYDERRIKTYYYIINALDVATTYRGLKHPNVREANPILGDRPSLGEMVALKLVVSSILFDLSEERPEDLIVPNTIVTLAVINNVYVLHRVNIIDW